MVLFANNRKLVGFKKPVLFAFGTGLQLKINTGTAILITRCTRLLLSSGNVKGR
jgi:low affinity Fe/Cu permease